VPNCRRCASACSNWRIAGRAAEREPIASSIVGGPLAQTIELTVGFSAEVSSIFRFYPARKASRLLLTEALRYE